MGRCKLCGKSSPLISDRLGVCLTCIRNEPESALKITDRVHADARMSLGLPTTVPKRMNGKGCEICANRCVLGPGDRGYCGLVCNIEDTIVRYGGTPERGVLEWYYDPLPTNCVSAWFCPGCTGRGYPNYSYSDSAAESGFSNLAVFYGACGFDCLYCQNWHFRKMSAALNPTVTATTLANKAKSNITCICYFGGDPSPQMPHAIRTSELAMANAASKGKILRVCWETNGGMNSQSASRAAELSLSSGGNLKFDLKCANENLNKALCGVSNASTLANFKSLGRLYSKRPEVPLLSASTLLVPGYVNAEEVKEVAGIIAAADARIPYSLLAFHPHYLMSDLPTTDRETAMRCIKSARGQGLEHVTLGNVHLLS